jgi:hypothetical protein
VAEGSLYIQSADRYGFGRYSIVIHAPATIADAVGQFRAAIGMAHVITEPHVSLLSHLHGLADLEELVGRLRQMAAGERPVQVEFAEPELSINGDSATLGIRASADLLALRGAAGCLLQGVMRSSSSPDAPWRPHLTLYQGGDDETAAKAKRLGRSLDLGRGFTASSVDLVGRLGTPPGGVRRVIESAALRGGLPARSSRRP